MQRGCLTAGGVAPLVEPAPTSTRRAIARNRFALRFGRRLAASLIACAACVACGGGKPAKQPVPPPDEVAYPAGTMSAPVNDAEKVMMALRPKIRACYEERLKSDPKVEGIVRMQMKVGPDGVVTAAQSVGDTTLPDGVVDCIASVLKAAKFGAQGPAGSTIEIPLSFTRKQE
jgi:hypothetical protein